MAQDQGTGQEETCASSRELSRATSDFISVIAHKIHTPITSAKWQLEMLLNEDIGPLTAGQREALQSVSEQAEKLNDLSRALLYVFEIEKDFTMVQPKQANIYALVTRAVKNLTSLAKDRGVYVEVKKPEKELAVHVDEELAFMVLRTLIENAIVYSPPKKGVMIMLKEQDNGNICVRVDDFGCGIPSDQQRRVFSKFFRASNAKRIWTDGTGLNLFVAKSIAQRTGGDLSFQSQENKGSSFFWCIPPHKAHREPWER
jgi:two-component system, OmpR family, phosphate regulon sensor histidine kinase PhoR